MYMVSTQCRHGLSMNVKLLAGIAGEEMCAYTHVCPWDFAVIRGSAVSA